MVSNVPWIMLLTWVSVMGMRGSLKSQIYIGPPRSSSLAIGLKGERKSVSILQEHKESCFLWRGGGSGMFRFCFLHFLMVVIQSGIGPADVWSCERVIEGTEGPPQHRCRPNITLKAAFKYREVVLSSPRSAFI